MTRILAASLTFATPVMAHDGFHPHPHGIQYGWMIAAAIGLLGGLTLAKIRGRK